ncbi:MAG: DUF58 domain-containing protein [Acidobacteria bacterium]|nr:DUF58 domain-containing protein [Acidobacteriota bacterium]
MSQPVSLAPPRVTAQALPQKRLGFAFGPRFFLLLVVGFIWLGPAVRQPKFLWAILAWDALMLVAWAIDLALLPLPKTLSVAREWLGPAALSVETKIRLTLENRSSTTLRAALQDNVPPGLRQDVAKLEFLVAPRGEASQEYAVRPDKRGPQKVGCVYLRYQGPLRIAERWAVAKLAQEVCVYPNLQEAQRHSIYLIRSRQMEIEKRYTRIRGAGREFESLREYREGDEFRDISWSASARRGKLVTRLYQIERSQTVWLVLDSGRLMRTRIAGLSKLDYAVNAALSLGQVALGSGDRIGLLAYGRSVQHRLLPYRGSSHLRHLIERLAHVREESGEADHLQAVGELLSSQKRRSLVVWITELAETAMTPEVIDAASQLTSRHVVVFVVIGQPDLAKMAGRDPDSIADMYQVTAAQEMMHRREVLLARLRQRGALAVEVSSAAASTAVVNSYLEVKQRNLL